MTVIRMNAPARLTYRVTKSFNLAVGHRFHYKF
jgi:hypothetical protein